MTTDDVGRDLAALAERVAHLEAQQLRREQVHGMLEDWDTWPETYCMGSQRLYERDRKQGPQEEM